MMTISIEQIRAARREDEPILVISAAAELAGMHPQTLRQYERLGLVIPGRTRGGARRYSLRDVATLREVQRLSSQEGINLAGVKRILALEAENRHLREQVELLKTSVRPGSRVFSADAEGDVVVLKGHRHRSLHGENNPDAAIDEDAALVLWSPFR